MQCQFGRALVSPVFRDVRFRTWHWAVSQNRLKLIYSVLRNRPRRVEEPNATARQHNYGRIIVPSILRTCQFDLVVMGYLAASFSLMSTPKPGTSLTDI